MRVGIDVSILSSRLTGIGYFTLSLVKALAGLQGDEWVLLGADPCFDGLPCGDNVIVYPVAGLHGWRRIAWQQLAVPGLAKRYRLDVLHCPDFSRPMHVAIPVVNTIHDLSYFLPDNYFSFPNRTYKRTLTRFTVRNDSEIVAVSKFTREELVKRFGVQSGRIHVIYHGFDRLCSSEPLQGEPPFVLYIGTLEKRKNVVTLVQGFTAMRSQSGFPHRLVLAGKPGRGFDRIQAAIRSSGCGNSIDLPGYLSREKLLQLYRTADALVFPSLYEGFGLPVLEAMSLGTPVICSRAASLPEVGGDAVAYFDPHRPEDIADTLERVLASPGMRSEMRQQGLARAKLFTWEECARRYRAVYADVL